MKFKRIFLIVIDSLGIGKMTDSEKFNDINPNTLGHISEFNQGIYLPTLEKLGIGNLTDIIGVKRQKPLAVIAKLAEISNGKDTLTGHLEMVGVKTTNPLITFTETGFPEQLITELENKINRKIIGNYAASGTEIIQTLGAEHLKTGAIIVYTSADSVLQICAHEEVVPLEELYKICEIARKLTLKDQWKVGRVIARPFTGKVGNFTRTANRHDYSLAPPQKTALDHLKNNQYSVISVGKINDIFAGHGITESNPIKSNSAAMAKILKIMKRDFTGLCFVNLVDFDSLYGHRRDPKGYKEALELFDSELDLLIKTLNNDDLLILTADHGNDPTALGSDHTREYVPLICYHSNIVGKILNDRETFADIGQTILNNFELKKIELGTSLLNEL